MEILSPAGSLQKLPYAWWYGADAAYMGVQGFSLRARADNAGPQDYGALARMKKAHEKKLYGAINLFAYDDDLDRLDRFLGMHLDQGTVFPFDAWILSDLGMLRIMKKHLPTAELHLSTQANCINSETAKLYRDLGFRRVIPGRELDLRGLAALKARVPDLEVEAFVHGAMCMAYSGRCFISAELTGRSANRGDCSHSCRWDYTALIEEEKRPGEYFTLHEEKGNSALFSSRDLNMVAHLREFRDAGVDAVKIEGRMKSAYYVALVTRAYRHALDALDRPDLDPGPFIEDLEGVSHRPYSTGFYLDRSEADRPAGGPYDSTHRFLGFVGADCSADPLFASWARDGWFTTELSLLNTLDLGMALEAVTPKVSALSLEPYRLSDHEGRETSRAVHQKVQYLHTRIPLDQAMLLRVPSEGRR